MAEPVAHQTPGWKRFVAFAAYCYIALFALTLRTLEFFTVPLDRQVVGFSVSYYFEFLALLGVIALPLAGALFGLRHMLRRRVAAWRVIHGLCVAFLFGSVVVHRAALNLVDWLGTGLWVWQAQALFAFATALLFGIWPPVRERLVKLSVVGAKLMALLPLVMAVYFASVPQYQTPYDDLPPAIEPAQPAAPVLVLVFDALDRATLVDDPEVLSQLPQFAACRRDFTWFENGRTSAFHTAEAVPGILYQQKVARADYNAAIDEGATPWAEDPTFFDLVAREGDVRIVSGYYVMYDRVVGGRVDCIRSRTLYYPKHHNVIWRARAHLRLFTGNNYVPLLSEGFQDLDYWDEYTMDIGLDMQNDALQSIQRYKGNLVGVFHFPWPHPPFTWDRDGPIEEEGTYLQNAHWADAKLAEIIDTLRAAGVYDSATLIVTGDHGYPLARQRHPPLFVKLPGQRSGRIETAETGTHQIVEWLHKQPEFNAMRPAMSD